MAATQEWLRDADVVLGGTHGTLEQALLDPLAWEARARWLATKKGHDVSDSTIKMAAGRDYNLFSDAIWDGKTIDEALSAIK